MHSRKMPILSLIVEMLQFQKKKKKSEPCDDDQTMFNSTFMPNLQIDYQ